MVVKRRGTGRKDYSENVELSTIPVIRSFQEGGNHVLEIDIDGGATEEIEIPLVEANFLFNFVLSANSNTLIGLQLYSEGILLFSKIGYQVVEINPLAGWPVDQLTIRIINHDTESHHFLYYHHGVKSSEKITPIETIA